MRGARAAVMLERMRPSTLSRPRSARSAAVVCCVLLAACGGEPPTRSGGTGQDRVLVAMTYFPTGYPSGDTLDHIVTDLAGSGTLTVRVEDVVARTDNEDPGSAALALVRAGDVDLAIVPTRIFDLVGSTSFQALQAPLRFESVEQADAVLTDPIAERMMEPLSDLGLVPLALTFDALRNVKGYASELTRPSAFAGRAVAARPSEATRMTLTALGATMYPQVGRTFEKDVASGIVAGLEDSINQSNLEGDGTSVANEFLSFKANVVVVNADLWRTLSAAQQDRLREAALAARDFSITEMAFHLDLATAAARYCEEGNGDVVLASDEDLAAMRQALEPVLAELRRDPLTAEAITRIDELAVEHPPATPVSPCHNRAPTPLGYSPVMAVGDQTVLNGTWRIAVDPQRLLDAGIGPTDASNNAGIWTFRIGEGHIVPKREGQAPCDALYRINGDSVSVIWDETTGCTDDFTIRFRFEDDQLWLSQASGPTSEIATFYDAFFASGLTRIAS